MAKPARAARSSGLRELLIGWREYTLPKSPQPPPKWSAPAGWPDELLDDLKAGRPAVVGSATLLSAFIAAGLPESSYQRFCYGGADYKTVFVLDEQDRLTECEPD